MRDRFWSKVSKTEDCWIWTGATFKNGGYGKFSKDGKNQYAHRIAYEFLIGQIPQGHGLDHKHTCPKVCVNPAHLRPTTQKQNMENRTGAQRNNLSTGVRGVSRDRAREKFHAKVKHAGRTINVGRFDSLVEAEAAVIALRNELFTHNDLDRMAV